MNSCILSHGLCGLGLDASEAQEGMKEVFAHVAAPEGAVRIRRDDGPRAGRSALARASIRAHTSSGVWSCTA